MPPISRSDIVRQLFAAYRTKDRTLAEAVLADKFTFTSPYDDAIDRAEYFRRCWPNSDRIRGHDLEKVWEQGNEVVVQYRCVTTDGREFRNAEIFAFDGDRIASVDVYFGRTLREA